MAGGGRSDRKGPGQPPVPCWPEWWNITSHLVNSNAGRLAPTIWRFTDGGEEATIFHAPFAAAICLTTREGESRFSSSIQT